MIDIDKIINEVLAEFSQPSGCGRKCSGQADCAACADGCLCLKESDIPRRLEHSLLTADLTKEKLIAECRMAGNIRAGAVCVAPNYVAEASSALAGSSTLVCAAVGFPSAFMSTQAKIADIRACVMRGASEIDLAIDISAVKSGDYAKAEKDFLSAIEVAHSRVAVKAVFEHGSYDAREKEAVLQMIGRGGVKFIKIQNMTSGHGARREEIALVRSVLGDKIKIKIDGGVKTLAQARELFDAGASRIGLTATFAIAKELKGE